MLKIFFKECIFVLPKSEEMYAFQKESHRKISSSQSLYIKSLTFHFFRAANFLNFSMLTADAFLLSTCWVSLGWNKKEKKSYQIIETTYFLKHIIEVLTYSPC